MVEYLGYLQNEELSLMEALDLRSKVILLPNTRADLQYKLNVREGILSVLSDMNGDVLPAGAKKKPAIFEFTRLVNNIWRPIEPGLEIVSLGSVTNKEGSAKKHPLLSTLNPNVLKTIFGSDFRDAALHISFVEQLLKTLQSGELQPDQKLQVATLLITLGSTTARLYEIPDLITKVEDSAMQVLWPGEYNQARKLRNAHLKIGTDLDLITLTKIENEVKGDFTQAININDDDLSFSLRLKGLYAFWLKHLANRSPNDTIGVTASISEKFLFGTGCALPPSYTIKNKLLELFTKLSISTLTHGVSKYERINMEERFDDGTMYEAYHIDRNVKLLNGKYKFPMEIRLNTFSQQARNLMMHPGYKGIFLSEESRENNDMAMTGLVARRNLLNALNQPKI